MKIEYINPFVSAAYSVLETTLGIKPEKGDLSVRTDGATSQQCTIVTGVTGRLAGAVMYGMQLVAADRIASIMLGQPVKTFDQLAASAIAELANMVSGNALAELADNGFVCDISPPSIVRGTNVRICSGVERALVIPLRLGEIEIELCVSLMDAQASHLRRNEGASYAKTADSR